MPQELIEQEIPEAQPEEKPEAKPARQKRGFVFVPGDVAILKLLYEFRFLRCEDVAALAGRHQMSIYRRLSKLLEEGYVTVRKTPQQKHLYGLAKRALAVLVEEGSAEPDLANFRIRTKELTDHFFKHEMMLVDIHVMLTLASRKVDAPLELADWQEGIGVWDDPVSFVGAHGLNKLPFRPDALFTIVDRRLPGRVGRHFFLEADRSHEVRPVFNEKILAYAHHHEQRIHTDRFGIPTFRVLTVTVSQARADNLCRMTANLPTSDLPERARKLFLYTSLPALAGGAHIFDAVYFSAQDPSTPRQLIPPPPPQQT